MIWLCSTSKIGVNGNQQRLKGGLSGMKAKLETEDLTSLSLCDFTFEATKRKESFKLLILSLPFLLRARPVFAHYTFLCWMATFARIVQSWNLISTKKLSVKAHQASFEAESFCSFEILNKVAWNIYKLDRLPPKIYLSIRKAEVWMARDRLSDKQVNLSG